MARDAVSGLEGLVHGRLVALRLHVVVAGEAERVRPTRQQRLARRRVARVAGEAISLHRRMRDTGGIRRGDYGRVAAPAELLARLSQQTRIVGGVSRVAAGAFLGRERRVHARELRLLALRPVAHAAELI